MKNDDTGIIRVDPPLKRDILTIRLLISCGLATMGVFLYWFIDAEHIGSPLIFWLLTFALSFKLLKMVHEWYHYWSPSVPVTPKLQRNWRVDILTTACPGEPPEMIIKTLRAMQAIRYPHKSYLCDEGDDPFLKNACEELGVIHVTRRIKVNAKAGNINNALKQADGEICVVLDPDHVPVPEFLDRVLPYFEDHSVGYVQCVQGYSNHSESFIARGAAEQTYHFYGPMMMCMNTYGTAQAIGANCTFRREALDSIGGHAAGLSEDMHTAMQLHAKGWKSVYIPEMLTRGLVPATLSAYYKQQLKWSRGTFELLFRTYPALFNKFTWRQKIHYFTLPFYFLYGLINLIDISVPLLALCMAEVPWEIDLSRFAVYFTALCIISIVIRMYAQRWLVEKRECGFHLHGGVLRTATWWIFLIGLIYTIFKIRVPYIPTPKEDDHQNYFRLCIPNILVMAVCAALIPYGLSVDYTPYSLAMASYSVFTAAILGLTVLMSQQKFLTRADEVLRKAPVLTGIAFAAGNWSRKCQQVTYGLLRNGTIMVIIVFSVLFLSYSTTYENLTDENFPEKEPGGFYLGLQSGGRTDVNQKNILSSAGRDLTSVTYIEHAWNPKQEPFLSLAEIKKNGKIPLISWHNAATNNGALYKEILNGRHKAYLQSAAKKLREFRDPVFLSFGDVEADQVESEQFILTWQYLYTFFNSLGISNITWVWHCPKPEYEAYYPGEKFIDWIGVSILNQSTVRPHSFSDIYESYRQKLGKFQKPVMIMSLRCASGENQDEWLATAFRDMSKNYREIHGTVLSEEDYRNDRGRYSCALTKESVAKVISGVSVFDYKLALSAQNASFTGDYKYVSTFISGKPGDYSLNIKGKPYYIQGVAYNTAHDWRDGNMPLTRRQVEKDFKKIREMGANTIRRYGTGIYDQNVLNIASEYQLNVIYGFWFDPKVDFYQDHEKVDEYLNEVEEKVKKYKDHPAVLAWAIGNESWGLLKHRFAKPYLVSVRRAYVQMIERMARRIHELDPGRPVFSCIEHEEYQIPGELVAFRDEAPSVDAIGINSYYKEQISKLNHLAWQFDSLRPYFVSEFGPEGYWDPKYNRVANGSIVEQSDEEKAQWYAWQWKNYVSAYKGNNLGGIAYCWHDRMEGSYSWFGLTDYRGRTKPAYSALKALWTGSQMESLPSLRIITPTAIIPGMTCTFTAVADKAARGCSYEWMLLKDEYLDRVSCVEVHNDASSANVTIPEEPSNYRLYVYMVDKARDRVSAASAPVRVTATLP
jgi:cellulose synthase (UDP-forming)